MYFRLLGLIVTAFIISSCSYFLDDEKSEADTVYDLSLTEKASINCLNNNTQVLKDYFNLKRSDKQIAIDLEDKKICMREAVDLFVRYTSGDGDKYDAETIHEFLKDTLNNYTMTEAFMVEVFQFKNSLISGGKLHVSKLELRELLTVVDYVYDTLIVNAPYRKYLLGKDRIEISDEERMKFDEAALSLTKSADRFKELPLKNKGVFDYNNLMRLASHLIDNDESKGDWGKSFSLINAIQSMIASGKEGEISSKKLSFVVDNLTLMYLGFTQFNIFLKDVGLYGDSDKAKEKEFYKDLSSVFTYPGLLTPIVKNHLVFEGGKSEVLIAIQKKLIKSVENAIRSAPGRKLSLKYFDGVFDVLSVNGALPDYLNVNTLKGMLPDFFGRWLTTGRCEKDCAVEYATIENIDQLKEIISLWKGRQDWINSVGQSQRGGVDLDYVEAKTQNLKAFKLALNTINHAHWEEYVVIGSKELEYRDMVILNSIYTMEEIFLRPFNKNYDKPTSEFFLTQEQTQEFYLWIRDLGIDLKLVDPRSRKSGESAFTEANLFTSISEDASKLSFFELLEYFEITISTGHRSVTLIENEFTDCKTTGLFDVFGYAKLDPECFRGELRENYLEFFTSTMPKFQKYAKEEKSYDPDYYVGLMEKAARQGMIVDEPIETDTFRSISSILQYAESLFLRFDKNKDGLIRTEEMKIALKHIVPNVGVLVRSTLDAETQKLLYRLFPDFERLLIGYIIKYERLPDILFAESNPARIPAIAQLKCWESEIESWLARDVRVNREDVLLVISGLSSYGRVSRVKNLRNLFNYSDDTYDYELDFDEGIKDINHPVFDKLAIELGCSSRIDKEIKGWLLQNQSKYWIKDEVSTTKIGFDKVSLNIDNELWSDWRGQVAKKLITLIYQEKKISNFCGLPYLVDLQVAGAPRALKVFEDRVVPAYKSDKPMSDKLLDPFKCLKKVDEAGGEILRVVNEKVDKAVEGYVKSKYRKYIAPTVDSWSDYIMGNDGPERGPH